MNEQEIQNCKKVFEHMGRSDLHEALGDVEIPTEVIDKAVPAWKKDRKKMEPLNLALLDPYLEKITFAKMHEACMRASGPA